MALEMEDDILTTIFQVDIVIKYAWNSQLFYRSLFVLIKSRILSILKLATFNIFPFIGETAAPHFPLFNFHGAYP